MGEGSEVLLPVESLPFGGQFGSRDAVEGSLHFIVLLLPGEVLLEPLPLALRLRCGLEVVLPVDWPLLVSPLLLPPIEWHPTSAVTSAAASTLFTNRIVMVWILRAGRARARKEFAQPRAMSNPG